MKIGTYSGLFLLITGILHTITAVLLNHEIYSDILKDGFINMVSDDYARAFAFWFLICGILLILFGQVLNRYQRKEQKPAPLFLGYSMLLFAVAGCIADPVSGFWLFIPQAVLIIVANKKMKV